LNSVRSKFTDKNGIASGDKMAGQVHRFDLFYLKALYRGLVENLRERYHLEDPDVDGK
jgi:hypothetical protein